MGGGRCRHGAAAAAAVTAAVVVVVGLVLVATRAPLPAAVVPSINSGGRVLSDTPSNSSSSSDGEAADTVQVPVWLPAAIALLASTIRGLTAFGDGIVYQSSWAACAALGIIDNYGAVSLRTSVLYSSIIQVVSMPITVWQGRAASARLLGYIACMASVGSGFVFLGAHLLLTANVAALKGVVGTVFLAFATGKASSLAYAFIARRKAAAAAAASAAAAAAASVSAVATDTIVAIELAPAGTAAGAASGDAPPVFAGAGAGAAAGGVGGKDEGDTRQLVTSAPSPAPPPQPAPPASQPTPPAPGGPAAVPVYTYAQAAGGWRGRCSAWLPPAWFPPVSPVMPPAIMLALLLAASTAGGTLSGLMGAGGPPMMMAYSTLELDKDTLRGFALVPSVYMIIRLVLFTTAAGSVYNPADWLLYVSIMAASVVGSVGGARLRAFVPSTNILRILLCLVLLASALLLAAARQPGVAAAYALGVAGWAAAVALLARYPHYLPSLPKLRRRPHPPPLPAN